MNNYHNMNLAHYGLHPTSDLTTSENATAFLRLWNDMTLQRFLHFSEYQEWLPNNLPVLVEVFGNRYSHDELHEIFCFAYDLENPENSIDETEYEVDEELVDDLIDFVNEKIMQKRADDIVIAEMERELNF